MSPPSIPPRSRNKPQATALAAHLKAIVGPALAARGLGEASLVAHWPEIVGAEVARFARFERLNWPPRGAKSDPEAKPGAAVLVLRIDGAFALEAQHLSRLIAERVNAHLGWRCVEKIAFRQGPLPEPPRRLTVSPPSAEAVRAARAATFVEEETLREALVRLGARVFDRGR